MPNTISLNDQFPADCRTETNTQAAPAPTHAATSHVGVGMGMLFLMGLCQPVYADVGVTALLQYVENPRQFEGADASDLIRGLSVDADFTRDTENFGVGFSYLASKTDYKENLERDRTILTGSGTVTWKIFPELLEWDLTNTRTNQVFDWELPNVPSNQQVVNVNSTGPRLAVPISANSLLSMNLNYSTADYEEASRLNQDTKSFNGSFSRLFSEVLTGSIKTSYSDTEYKDSGLPGYNLASVSVETMFTYSELTLALELGRYRTDSDLQGSETSPLLLASANYQLNSLSSVSLSYRETVEDQLSDLTFFSSFYGFGPQDPEVPPGEFGSSNTLGLYTNTSLSATYAYQIGGEYDFQLNYTDTERNYLGPGRDEDRKSINVRLGIPLSERISAGLSTRFSEYTYSTTASSLQERQEVRGDINYQLGAQMRLSFSVWTMEQDSEDDLTNFEDLNALISVSYRF